MEECSAGEGEGVGGSVGGGVAVGGAAGGGVGVGGSAGEGEGVGGSAGTEEEGRDSTHFKPPFGMVIMEASDFVFFLHSATENTCTSSTCRQY